MRNIVIILVVCASVISSGAHAQLKSSECKELVRKCYQSVSTEGFSSTKKQLSLTYQTKVETWDPENNPSVTTNVKLIANKNQVRMETSEASFFADQKDVFIVVHHTRDIIRQNPVMNGDKNFYSQQASLLKDSLIIKSTVTSCQDEKDTKGNTIKWITLVPPREVQQIYQVKQVRFRIDVTAYKLLYMEIEYSKYSSVKKISNTYSDIRVNGSDQLSNSVYSIFFDKNNKLKPAYKNYEYSDYTK